VCVCVCRGGYGRYKDGGDDHAVGENALSDSRRRDWNSNWCNGVLLVLDDDQDSSVTILLDGEESTLEFVDRCDRPAEQVGLCSCSV